MAYLYYTITAVILYLLSDWILNKIEIYYGKRFEYRSVIFFVIHRIPGNAAQMKIPMDS